MSHILTDNSRAHPKPKYPYQQHILHDNIFTLHLKPTSTKRLFHCLWFIWDKLFCVDSVQVLSSGNVVLCMPMVVKVGLSDKLGAIKSHRKNISPPHLGGKKSSWFLENLVLPVFVVFFTGYDRTWGCISFPETSSLLLIFPKSFIDIFQYLKWIEQLLADCENKVFL